MSNLRKIMPYISIGVGVLIIAAYLISNYYHKEYISEEKQRLVANQHAELKAKAEKKKNNTFSGLFSYMADANIFELCDGKNSYGISMQEAYIDIERKYISMNKAGENVYMEIEGKLTEEMGMEAMETVIIATKLIKMDRNQSCP